MVEITDKQGKRYSGTKVSVDESTERFSTVRLTDGTVIRIKAAVTEALRVDGEYDQNGNPVYVVNSTNIVQVDSTPDNLKRKLQS